MMRLGNFSTRPFRHCLRFEAARQRDSGKDYFK